MSMDWKLPRSWRWATLSDIAEIGPKGFRSPPKDSDEVSFVPMAAVEEETGRLDPTQRRKWGEVKKGYTVFENGDIVFAKVTPCMENGKCALADGLAGGRGAGSTELFVLRPREVEPRYLLHYLLWQGFRREARGAMQGVAGLLRVRREFMEKARVPVPPRPEQDRIVAEIEKHFTRLDAGVDALKRLQAHMWRYRAALLKAACEGKLVATEAALARKAGRPFDSGQVLLSNILRKRRALHEASQPKKKYREPDSGLAPRSALPEGWGTATVEQLAAAVDYGSSSKTSADGGVPVLRMGNIVNGSLDTSELKYLPKSHDEFPYLLLRPGDLLFNRTNSPELVGKTAVYAGSPSPCSFASYLIRVRLVDGYSPYLLSAYINSAFGRAWVKEVVTQQVGQANVNGTKLQALVVPVPPAAEQTRIVDELARRLTEASAVEATIERAFARSARLRASILRDAFTACLLPSVPPGADAAGRELHV